MLRSEAFESAQAAANKTQTVQVVVRRRKATRATRARAFGFISNPVWNKGWPGKEEFERVDFVFPHKEPF